MSEILPRRSETIADDQKQVRPGRVWYIPAAAGVVLPGMLTMDSRHARDANCCKPYIIEREERGTRRHKPPWAVFGRRKARSLVK
jgi:hypothetical protein